jgi:hypothetical protein
MRADEMRADPTHKDETFSHEKMSRRSLAFARRTTPCGRQSRHSSSYHTHRVIRREQPDSPQRY